MYRLFAKIISLYLKKVGKLGKSGSQKVRKVRKSGSWKVRKDRKALIRVFSYKKAIPCDLLVAWDCRAIARDETDFNYLLACLSLLRN